MMHENLPESIGGVESYPFKIRDSLKARGLFIGWIAGILVAGGGVWFYTQPLRSTILLQTVNQVLESIQDSRRLEELIPHPVSWGRIPWGSWYTLVDSEDRAVVFSVMNQGIFIPCMAVVSASTGKVVDDTILPLTKQPEQTLKQIPRGIITSYIRRIESPPILQTGARQ
ncbi:MAG: hypothetical protein LBL76_10610 [Treponema sp.]|jgi:hypothetical protein|nr:hypothetical protein [Treponema sp.]